MNALIADIAMMTYIIFIAAAFIGSYTYGSFMIRKTGLFLLYSIIAVIISLGLGIFAILGWFLFTWGVNEFMFFGGLNFGAGLLVVGEVILFTILCFKRKEMIQTYNESL